MYGDARQEFQRPPFVTITATAMCHPELVALRQAQGEDDRLRVTSIAANRLVTLGRSKDESFRAASISAHPSVTLSLSKG